MINKAFVCSLNEVFKREGYTTFLAANGIEALELAERIKPDGVLLDMKIPGMDGIEILKRIKIAHSRCASSHDYGIWRTRLN